MNQPLPQSVSNFLVPATGSTNSVVLDQILTAGVPVRFDFANYSISGIPFRPSGVLIDNSAATAPTSVQIPEIGYTMICAVGEMLHLPYPAPLNHSAIVSGEGDVTVIFVDYPVIPFSSKMTANVTDPVPTFASVTADDGVVFSPDSLAQTLNYNLDDTLNYVEVVYGGNTYRQTLTYSGGNVTAVSEWVKQ